MEDLYWIEEIEIYKNFDASSHEPGLYNVRTRKLKKGKGSKCSCADVTKKSRCRINNFFWNPWNPGEKLFFRHRKELRKLKIREAMKVRR